MRKLPITTVVALIDAGAVCGYRGKEGIAGLTSELLLEGTGEFNGAALTERLERLGTSIDPSANWDGTWLTFTALKEQLPPALSLLARIIREPAFPEREVERLKAERLADLLKLRAEPRGLADVMFSKVLYHPESRFTLPESGSERSVPQIAREDVHKFYGWRYQPRAVTLVIVGDITTEEAARLAEDSFGGWKGSSVEMCGVNDQPARRTRALHIVAKPDAKQSEVRIGNVGIPRNHADYHATVVMNAVLGGLFSSRINLNLRERHGYTYGAFSHFDWRRHAGPFMVSTAVQSEVTAPAAREAVNELERIRQEKVSEDELSLATSYLDGVFPIRYETTHAIAGALAALVEYRLPDDFYDCYREQVRSVTTGDVLRVAQAHVHPDALQLLVVGDPDMVRKPCEALGFGEAALYDTEGNVLEGE
jgi:zinc protease